MMSKMKHQCIIINCYLHNLPQEVLNGMEASILLSNISCLSGIPNEDGQKLKEYRRELRNRLHENVSRARKVATETELQRVKDKLQVIKYPYFIQWSMDIILQEEIRELEMLYDQSVRLGERLEKSNQERLRSVKSLSKYSLGQKLIERDITTRFSF